MKLLLRYLLVFLSYGIIFLFLLSFVILPLLTNKNDVIYLPDVRNYNILKAEKILNDMNFKIKIIKNIHQMMLSQ